MKQYLEKGVLQRFGAARIHLVGLRHRAVRAARLRRRIRQLALFPLRPLVEKPLQPQTGWLQSRNADGSWKPLGEDWRESTYKNYFWMVPYDLAGLIETMGGKAAAEKRLDEFFVRLDAGYNDPWFASGNEPSFHIPWVYNWLDDPTRPRRSSTASSTSSTRAPPTGCRATTTWARWEPGTSSHARGSTP